MDLSPVRTPQYLDDRGPWLICGCGTEAVYWSVYFMEFASKALRLGSFAWGMKKIVELGECTIEIAFKSVAFGRFGHESWKKSWGLENVRSRLVQKRCFQGVLDMKHEKNRWAWRAYDQEYFKSVAFLKHCSVTRPWHTSALHRIYTHLIAQSKHCFWLLQASRADCAIKGGHIFVNERSETLSYWHWIFLKPSRSHHLVERGLHKRENDEGVSERGQHS